MELTPVQRIVTFTVVVLVLAGLGAYLFLPKSSDGASAAGRPKPASQPSQSAQPTTPPATPPASSPPGTTGSGKSPDIYSWLPFTESGLGTAARVTTSFANDYGTFSYQETTNAYLAPMKPLMTTALAVVVGRAFATPGVMAQRVKDQQTSTASATITSLRAFGPDSLTFVVNLVQHLKGTKGESDQVDNYAITATGSGSTWQVSDIEFASAGNQ
jgi:hypothetical protein